MLPRIVQVGVGYWGGNHLSKWHHFTRDRLCELVGVVDISEATREAVRGEAGVGVFSTLAECSSSVDFDAVDVVVPTDQHFAVASEALLSHAHVMVEKPITATVDEAVQLQQIAKENGLTLMVGHLFLYNPAVERTLSLIKSGEIGDIRFLKCAFSGFRDKESDAGIIATTMIHFIYLSNYLMGSFPNSVRAESRSLIAPPDDWARATLSYGTDEGPGFSALEVDYFTHEKQRVVEVIGTRGTILLDALHQKVTLHRRRHVLVGDRYRARGDDQAVPQDVEFQEPLALELGHFLECISQGGVPKTGAEEGIETLRIVQAAYESSHTDSPITL